MNRCRLRVVSVKDLVDIFSLLPVCNNKRNGFGGLLVDQVALKKISSQENKSLKCSMKVLFSLIR